MKSLRITKQAMALILDAARTANGDERMGLIASPEGSDVVTDAAVLPATASPSHAEASPTAIKQLAQDLAARKLVPRGIWHSHGHMNVFHSGTDRDTVNRLLPAMAPWNFKRPRPSVLAPALTGPDSAVLRFLDSQMMEFSLLGPKIGGMEATELVAWKGMEHTFGEDGKGPHAVLEAHRLHLEGGGVTISLGIPEGATLSCTKVDCAPFRVATLYSLVVNSRGVTCAECLVIHEVDGHCLTQQQSCTVQITEANTNDGSL